MRKLLSMSGGLLLTGLLSLTPQVAQGQGTCEVNNQAACPVGGDAAHAIAVTITTAARLTSATSTIALPAPDGASFTSGFGLTATTVLSVRSNTSWAVTLRSASAEWSATPLTAWQNKPVTDLQFAVEPDGPFVDITTLAQSVVSGAATGGTNTTLFLRAKYSWAADSPGTYSLPLEIALSAP